MKSVSILVPTYNEEENILFAYNRIKGVIEPLEEKYIFSIIFIDNCSTDNSRGEIEKLCKVDSRVGAIFNAKNFGFTRSTFYGLTQMNTDCSILLFADMQDPPEMIEHFLYEWENGHKVVCGIKTESAENPIMYFTRGIYYKLIKTIAGVEHIEHFTGFGLYDKVFIDVLNQIEDPMPYLRGMVAEFGMNRKDISYRQEERKFGSTSFNFFKLYDLAMLGITSYSKALMRIATFIGGIMAVISLLVGFITLIMKLMNWNDFPTGIAAIAVGVFFLGSIQLFFIGILGEYVLSINTRIMKRPLVVESKRINLKQRRENVE